MNLIIDLETLSTHQDAVILSISAAFVDSDGEASFFHQKLCAKTQGQRRVEKGTLDWWKGLPAEAQRRSLIPSKGDINFVVACTDFAKWLGTCGYDKKEHFIWQRGSKDLDWLTSLMTDAGWAFAQLPFNWWKVREIRTAVDVLGHSSKLRGFPDNVDDLRASIRDYIAHDSISDIKLEIKILNQLGIIPSPIL